MYAIRSYYVTTSAPETADLKMDAVYADQFTQVIDNVISAEFRIDLPYTIKSNNQQHMVLVKNVDRITSYNVCYTKLLRSQLHA